MAANKMPGRKTAAILCTLLLAIAPALGAQDIGNVGLRSVYATLATAVTCTGSAQTFVTSNPALQAAGFRNLGQVGHTATAVSNAATFVMEIDGIDTAGNVFRISDLQVGVPTSAKGGLVVTANGLFSNIQVSVTCTAGATFTVSYSGTFTSIPQNVAGALLVATDKLPFQTAAANTTATVTLQSPSGNSGGTIIFQYAATGPSGSTATVQCISNAGVNLQVFTFPIATGTGAQLFQVTQSSCPFASLTYTSGGASATTYNLEYVFNQSGTVQTLSTANSGPSSTNALQVVSDAASQAFVAADTIVNPGSVNALYIGANNGTRSLYFDHLVISCSAACLITIVFSTSAPTGCSAGSTSTTNLKMASTVTTTGTISQGCTTTPGFDIQNFPIAAGVPATFDLRGAIAPNGTSTGIGVLVTAFTGNFSASAFWYEK